VPQPTDALETRLIKGPAMGRVPKFDASKRASEWPMARHDVARTGSTTQTLALPARLLWQSEAVGGKPTPPVVANGLVFIGSTNHQMHCYDAASGKARWSYTVGGAITLAPAVHEDLVLFGATDGWVTCLLADTGEVAWKFQAAPARNLVLNYGTLISSWPVSSGVMLDENVAYFCAGQEANDGIYVYAVEPRTGKLLWHNWSGGQFSSVKLGKGKEWRINASGPMLATDKQLIVPSDFELPIFMEKQTGKLVRKGAGSGGGTRQCISDNWLIVGMASRLKNFSEQPLRGGSYFVHAVTPAADAKATTLPVINGEFNVETTAKLDAVANIRSDNDKYSGKVTFAQDGPVVVAGGTVYGAIWRANGTEITSSQISANPKPTLKVSWVQRVPLLARAAATAGTLYVCAGNKPEPQEGKLTIDKLYESANQPVSKRQESILAIFDRAAGEPKQEIGFSGTPVVDGIAVAYGRIYLSMQDGWLVCIGKE
jgi:outer membrane protein assembly factor BamB